MDKSFLVIIFLVYNMTTFTYGQEEVYIIPSHNLTCSQYPCSTLSDLAFHSNLTGNHVIFYLMPGSHILDHDLIVSDINNISIARAGGSTIIKCVNQGRFMISSTTTVSMWGIHFYGCGGNILTKVDNFFIQSTIFHGHEDSTALILRDIRMVNIIACSYFNNTQGSSIQEFEGPLFLGANNMNIVGGAIIAINSSVNIDNVVFEGNSAQFGAAIFIGKSSNISIINSQFLKNKADNAGVGVLFVDQDCSLQVSNTTFSENIGGFGIISSYKSSIAISNSSAFISNTVLFYGGAVFVYDGSLQISDSRFSNNIGGDKGGAVAILNGSCDIAGSTFNGNTANLGGALYTFFYKPSVYGLFDMSGVSIC